MLEEEAQPRGKEKFTHIFPSDKKRIQLFPKTMRISPSPISLRGGYWDRAPTRRLDNHNNQSKNREENLLNDLIDQERPKYDHMGKHFLENALIEEGENGRYLKEMSYITPGLQSREDGEQGDTQQPLNNIINKSSGESPPPNSAVGAADADEFCGWNDSQDIHLHQILPPIKVNVKHKPPLVNKPIYITNTDRLAGGFLLNKKHAASVEIKEENTADIQQGPRFKSQISVYSTSNSYNNTNTKSSKFMALNTNSNNNPNKTEGEYNDSFLEGLKRKSPRPNQGIPSLIALNQKSGGIPRGSSLMRGCPTNYQSTSSTHTATINTQNTNQTHKKPIISSPTISQMQSYVSPRELPLVEEGRERGVCCNLEDLDPLDIGGGGDNQHPFHNFHFPHLPSRCPGGVGGELEWGSGGHMNMNMNMNMNMYTNSVPTPSSNVNRPAGFNISAILSPTNNNNNNIPNAIYTPTSTHLSKNQSIVDIMNTNQSYIQHNKSSAKSVMHSANSSMVYNKEESAYNPRYSSINMSCGVMTKHSPSNLENKKYTNYINSSTDSYHLLAQDNSRTHRSKAFNNGLAPNTRIKGIKSMKEQLKHLDQIYNQPVKGVRHIQFRGGIPVANSTEINTKKGTQNTSQNTAANTKSLINLQDQLPTIVSQNSPKVLDTSSMEDKSVANMHRISHLSEYVSKLMYKNKYRSQETEQQTAHTRSVERVQHKRAREEEGESSARNKSSSPRKKRTPNAGVNINQQEDKSNMHPVSYVKDGKALFNNRISTNNIKPNVYGNNKGVENMEKIKLSDLNLNQNKEGDAAENICATEISLNKEDEGDIISDRLKRKLSKPSKLRDLLLKFKSESKNENAKFKIVAVYGSKQKVILNV